MSSLKDISAQLDRLSQEALALNQQAAFGATISTETITGHIAMLAQALIHVISEVDTLAYQHVSAYHSGDA